MNAMVEANLSCNAAAGANLPVAAIDEEGLLLDGVVLSPASGNTLLRERKLSFTKPVIFKQMSIRVAGISNPSVRIGNLYMRHQILGYNNDDLEDGNFLLADDGVTILTDDASVSLTPG
jgi:hypothetical protein